MVNEATIQKAVIAVRQAVPTGSRVFLFGSCASGNTGDESDIDLLVVEPEVHNRWNEMVRLRKAVGRIDVPVDVIVIAQQAFTTWKDTPGTLYHEAVHKGIEYAALS